MQRRIYPALAILLIAALLIGGVWTYRSGRQPATATREPVIPSEGVRMTASRADTAGVEPTAAFHLASATPLTLAEVKERLTVAPAM